MKKIFLIAAALLAVCACRRESPAPQGTGSLSLALTYGGEYRTKAADADINNFVITLSRADGWTKTYDRYGDMAAMLELGSGNYHIVASSPDDADAAFDQPVYRGEADFTIRAGELTPVSMVCSLANMKVTFVLSDRFRNELSNYTVTVTNAASWDDADAATRTLIWTKDDIDEGKAGYFSVAPLKIKVDGYRTIDDSEAHAMLAISDVAAKDHHIVTLDAQVTGQVGGLTLSIDATLNDKTSNVDVLGWDEVPVSGGDDPDPNQGGDDPDPNQGGDDPTPSTAPTMAWEANPTFADMPIADVMDVNIQITAPKRIKTFTVNVDSDLLAPTIAALAEDDTYTDGPYLMDLIGNATLIEALGPMGVPTGDQLFDKESVLFSLSDLVPMIAMYQPAPGSKHIFTLRVTDTEDQVLEKALTFVGQ